MNFLKLDDAESVWRPCRGDDVDVGDGAETKNMGRSHFGNFETDRISRMKNKSNVMICYGRTKRLKQPV